MAEPGDARVPTLVVTGGPLDGSSFPVDLAAGEALLGSAPGCQVQIELGNVEAVHARLFLSVSGVVLSDAGSATGTFVNGERVEGEHTLNNGDRICLGPPGSKGSAKMLVALPEGYGESEAGLVVRDEDEIVDAAPVLVADEEPVIVSDEVEAPPVETIPFKPVEPPPPPPPPFSTAPPPPPHAVRPQTVPPAVAPPAAARPPSRGGAEYQTELPSLPVERPQRERLTSPAPAAVARPRRPATTRARRRRSFTVPREAILGGAAVLLVLAAVSWWLMRRPPAPELRAANPARVEPGQPLVLSGRNFAGDVAADRVRFGNEVAPVTAATSTEIKTVSPPGLAAPGPATVAVTVESNGRRSGALTLPVYRGPRIAALEPDVALPGQSILVRGQSLATQPLVVTVGGIKAQVERAAAEEIRIVVPDVRLPEGATTSVVVQAGNETTPGAELAIGRMPLVMRVTPDRVALGERATLTGRGFDPRPAGNVVTVGGVQALVVTASATELTIVAPFALSAEPDLPLVVTAKGRTASAGRGLAVTRVGGSTFLPRFFAAPVPGHPDDNVAFVSSELGPVLLLGDKADSPSTAERAERVASALNALVAAGNPPTLEVREGPPPSVAVVGAGTSVVAATAADAAAHSRPWPGAPRGLRAATSRSLAAHWTTLLQDYLGLFLARQRPLRMLAASAQGKVLNDIYVEASRRSPGGPGVPTSAVFPLGTTMAEELRQLALVVGGSGGGQVAMALEGRWEGTLEDPEFGSRTIQVRLRTDRGRLAGTLTAWQGPLESTMTLREVSFARGTVRFVADMQGAPHEFQAALQNDTLSGTVARRGAGRPPGQLTLRFME